MSDTPRRETALTPEEWTRGATGNDDTGDVFRSDNGTIEMVLEPRVCVQILNPHGTAALCLYQQPFGFSQEDLEILRLARFSDALDPDDFAVLDSLKARIAALLPPSSSTP